MVKNKKGIFITFEGGEGCGKSTHAKLLMDHLVSSGSEVVLTREPGGTSIGATIREILAYGSEPPSNLTELLLFAADRSEHIEKVILPALKAGKIIISDRFIDSTIAYQIAGRALPEDLVRYLNTVSSKGVYPDLTILLDLPVEEGQKRAKLQNRVFDRFESENIEFHKRIREKYLEIAKESPKRIKVINSLRKTSEVQEQIWETLKTEVQI
jgi:dTMP kinase